MKTSYFFVAFVFTYAICLSRFGFLAGPANIIDMIPRALATATFLWLFYLIIRLFVVLVPMTAEMKNLVAIVVAASIWSVSPILLEQFRGESSNFSFYFHSDHVIKDGQRSEHGFRVLHRNLIVNYVSVILALILGKIGTKMRQHT